MSLLSVALGALTPTWLDGYLAASFRGVPFYVEDHGAESGRRLAVRQFPGRDDAYVEDLGLKNARYVLRAYILTPDYFDARDQLRAALTQAGPGTLIHPYLGTISVYVDSFRLTETQDRGGMARFDLNFVDAGVAASPVAAIDTASLVLTRVTDAMAALVSAFTRVFTLVAAPDFVVASAQSVLNGFGTRFSALIAGSGLAPSGFASALAPYTGLAGAVPTDAATIAAGVTGLFSSFAAAMTGPSAPSATVSATLGSWTPTSLDAILSASQSSADYVTMSRAAPAPADPSLGLSALQSWTAPPPSAPPTATPSRQWLLTNAAAITALLQSSALVATAQIYANTSFQDSAAALSAQESLLSSLDQQILIASAAGDDDSVEALTGLSEAVSSDLTTRAAQTPILGSYAVPASLPSLVLAQRLYQDPTQADILTTLNAVAHPAFMPASGAALDD